MTTCPTCGATRPRPRKVPPGPPPPHLERRRIAAEQACGVTPSDHLWARGPGGKFIRGGDSYLCSLRAAVWKHMHDDGLGYRNIAWACGMTDHTTIRKALKKQR